MSSLESKWPYSLVHGVQAHSWITEVFPFCSDYYWAVLPENIFVIHPAYYGESTLLPLFPNPWADIHRSQLYRRCLSLFYILEIKHKTVFSKSIFFFISFNSRAWIHDLKVLKRYKAVHQ